MIDQICPKCQSCVPKVKAETKNAKISLGFIYHLALDLQFSFQSIALMVDFAQKREAKKFQIMLYKIMDNENVEIPDQHYEQNYVEIRFDGNALTKIEAQELGNSYHSQLKQGMDLVLSIFGTGKTGLMISNNGTETSYVLFSVDDRVNPNYCKEETGMVYIENNVTKANQNLNGKVLKKIIMQGLKIYHPHPEKIIQCPPNISKVLIFHPKIFVSSNKLMFYEIRQSNYGHDIDTHYNPQKIQFLNKLGYQMAIHAEFRLSCYLSCLHLQYQFPIIIGGSQRPICKTTYIEYLQTLKLNGVLTKLNEVKINGAIRVDLFETTDKYFMQNNGILLYWNGRMINRFDIEFGRMIEEKFFMKRYRSPPRNIWNIVGIVELDSNKFTPNLVKNKFLNTFEYRRFCKDLQMFLENINRRSHAIVIENQDEQEEKGSKVDSEENLPNSEPRKRVKRSKQVEQHGE